jgi:hypothetical protein
MPADLCHPVLSHVPFTRDGWLFELKHDGFRTLAKTGRSGAQLLFRSGRSLACQIDAVSKRNCSTSRPLHPMRLPQVGMLLKP